MDSEISQLIENYDKSSIGDFVVWGLETLHKRLLEKHNETFWIAADCSIGWCPHRPKLLRKDLVNTRPLMKFAKSKKT
jgi:MvaI/BcnI restriction endonuclease family